MRKFISKGSFGAWIRELKETYKLYYPAPADKGWDWSVWEGKQNFFLEGYRPLLPVKYLFFSPEESLAAGEQEPAIVFGVRGCDLRALQLLKKIYLDAPEDVYFRKETLIFGADCTACHEHCFCTLLGDDPWPGEGFDLNFSPMEEGYLVESGSKKGEELLAGRFFTETREEHAGERDERRKEVKKILRKQNQNKVLNLQDLKKHIIEEKIVFRDYGSTCVSCSACTNICPGCFCFFLAEGKEQKVRYMDSCQLKGYHRVAGGANPRKDMTSRFKHRFQCKFYWRPEMQGYKGCTGCGRCITACQGKIDWKHVLIELKPANI
ncbi:MAG TPA: 4Fe-4S dicluster domain-containing protein [bacterium]|nr:4Fe-4S dicluster domain-containing protein [bacterium]